MGCACSALSRHQEARSYHEEAAQTDEVLTRSRELGRAAAASTMIHDVEHSLKLQLTRLELLRAVGGHASEEVEALTDLAAVYKELRR